MSPLDEDRFTNTVEDAAAFGRRHGQEAGDYDDDRPTLAELEAEEEDERRYGSSREGQR